MSLKKRQKDVKGAETGMRRTKKKVEEEMGSMHLATTKTGCRTVSPFTVTFLSWFKKNSRFKNISVKLLLH